MFVRTLGTHITLEARATTEKLAYVDRNLFESAVLNLVLNARDAMPNGGVVTIETVALESADDIPGDLRNGDYVHVCVRDTGVGMAKDVLDRAFDPFFTTKGLGKGTGMGLSMVYGFAKQSGGHVSIDSKPGQGTAVHLYLPIARDEVIAKPIEAPKERPPEGGHEKILVVEDEPHVRQFVTMQLNGLGYSVLEAEAGAAALEILRGEPAIDLLFTDLLMPGGMSGFDLVERARALCPDLKVLLTTGYAAEADSMLADVKDPILKKPYKKQQLAEALRTVLEQAA
jgi:two-component system CheB/CheR fusion protein